MVYAWTMYRTAVLAALLVLPAACSDDPVPGPAGGAPSGTAESTNAGERAPALVLRVTKPSTEDWDVIRERKVLRVLVSYSRTNFFIAKGRVRGFEYELFHELEKHLAEKEADILKV